VSEAAVSQFGPRGPVVRPLPGHPRAREPDGPPPV